MLCICFFSTQFSNFFFIKYVSCKTFLQKCLCSYKNIFVLFFSHVAFNLSFIYINCWEQLIELLNRSIELNYCHQFRKGWYILYRLWIYQFYDYIVSHLRKLFLSDRFDYYSLCSFLFFALDVCSVFPAM